MVEAGPAVKLGRNLTKSQGASRRAAWAAIADRGYRLGIEMRIR